MKKQTQKQTRSYEAPTTPAQAAPMHLIQQRAYEKYLQRGKKPGYELEDWLHAEREVLTAPANRQTVGA